MENFCSSIFINNEKFNFILLVGSSFVSRLRNQNVFFLHASLFPSKKDLK